MSGEKTLSSAIYGLSTSLETAFPSADAAHLHPLAPNPPDDGALRQLLNVTSLINSVLSNYPPPTDPKLVSLHREHAAHMDNILQAEAGTKSRLSALSKPKRPSLYGEDIPLSRDLIPQWIIDRIESHAREAGLDVYRDPDLKSDGVTAIALSGKILVLDIELRTSLPPDNKIALTSLKLSHAPPSNAPPLPPLPSEDLLDELLSNSLLDFIDEAYKEEPDCVKAAEHVGKFSDSLRYLTMLDGFASSEGEEGKGVRWFREIVSVSQEVESLTTKEASAVAQSLHLSEAPLDLLLNKGHAIPFLYINYPSLSFLVHATPLGYLSLLKSHASSSSHEPSQFNIPITLLRSTMYRNSSSNLFTVATLKVSSSRLDIPPQPTNQSLDTRPLFPLLDPPPELSLAMALPQNVTPTTSAWVLDFGEGVVVSKTSMSAIYALSGFSPSPNLGMDFGSALVNSLGMGATTSWVDLLIDTNVHRSAGRYTYTHISPTSLHPSLRITLTTPMDPGFVLGKVPVRNLGEILGILEVVRDQCWLNDFVKGRAWTQVQSVMGLSPEADVELEMDLQSILHGIKGLGTESIPVQVTIPTPTPTPSVTLTFPLPLPSSPLCRATISHEPTAPRGLRVVLEGLGAERVKELEMEDLKNGAEEVVRRGNGFGVAGWIWARVKALRGDEDMRVSPE